MEGDFGRKRRRRERMEGGEDRKKKIHAKQGVHEAQFVAAS